MDLKKRKELANQLSSKLTAALHDALDRFKRENGLDDKTASWVKVDTKSYNRHAELSFDGHVTLAMPEES